MKKILIGTPVRQDPEILMLFLKSLDELNKDGVQVDYCFVDDNVDELSKKYLSDFTNGRNVKLIKGVSKEEEYAKNEQTHFWNGSLINKVADFKNQIISEMLNGEYDYLFFVDSDLILHQQTLQKLLDADKDVISEVFWTKWTPGQMELPQVWLKDTYSLYDFNAHDNLSKEEIYNRQMTFINNLKKPGVYEVGGLGALTLIKRKVFEAGVNFKEVKNISFWGEDRHFCIRAVVHGFGLYVDTHYPAFHIYRKTDLFKLLS